VSSGIKLAFVSDVRELLSGTKDVEGALEKVADSLDDVQAAGEKSTDKLTKSFKETYDDVKRGAADTGDKVGRDIKRGTEEASEGTKALSQNAASNAKEVAASFDGSAQSIADGFQGLAAEAFEGWGPAGMAASVAAGVGIGLVSSQLEKAKEQAQETAEQVADLAGELIGIGGERGPSEVNDALLTMATTAEDGTVKINDLADAASGARIDFQDFARGVAGDTESQRRSFAEIEAGLDTYRAGLARVKEENPGNYGALKGYIEENEAWLASLTGARDELVAVNGTLDQAATTAENYARAVDTNAEAVARAQEAQQAYQDTLADAAAPVGVYEDLLQRKESAEQATAQATADATEDATDSWQAYAKDVAVTIDDMIAELDKQAQQAKDFEANLATITAAGGQAIADELRAKGPEVAGAVADVLAEASPEKQAEYIQKYATATGEQVAQATADGITGNASAIADAASQAVAGIPAQSIPVEADVAVNDQRRPTSTPLRSDAPTQTTRATPQTTTITGPITAHLSEEDRTLMRQLIAAPIAVSIPVKIDGRQVASAMQQLRRQANLYGGRRG
jgi:hypothetical protein